MAKRGEAEGPQRPRKKQRTLNPFIETEAQEDDEYEDEEEYEEFDEEAELGEEEAEAAAEMALRDRRLVDSKLGEAAGTRVGGTGHFASTLENLERRFQDQDFSTGEYEAEGGIGMGVGGAGGAEMDEYGYEEGDLMMGYHDVEGDMSKLLPTGGMKLWRVPVIRPGVERETCINILKKYAETPDSKKHLFLVGAAYASDTVKGCIYVEAMSPLHLIEALREVRTLMLIRSQIKMVPEREMPDVFAINPALDRLPQRGEWGRVQRGLYAGDICLISDVLDDSAIVRVVPRIDLDHEARAQAMEAQTGQHVVALKGQPLPRLVTQSDLDERKIEAEHVGERVADCLRFRGHLVEENSGYALREVKLTQLLLGDAARIKPREIEFFLQGQDPNVLGQQWGLSLAVHDTGADLFEPDQRVQVTKGELAGMSGVVKSIENGKLIIQPDKGSLKDTEIQIEPSVCVKKFSLGESVKVVAGSHEGDIGLITKIDIIKSQAEVLSTDTHKQITCSLAHLTSIPNDAITPVGLTKIDGYGVGDLVSLATTSQVGVITRLHKSRRVEVVTKEGPIACDVSQLSGKRTLKVAHALDAENNQFGTGATVEILEGPAARTVGTVKYIWKDTVFIQPLSGSPNPVVSESNAVRISKSAEDSKVTDVMAPGGPGMMGLPPGGGMPMASAGRGSGPPIMSHGGRGGIGFRRQFSLMGRPVKLVGGQHKGLLGELRSVQGPDALVLVSALNKELRLPRQYIELIGGSASDLRSGADRIFRRSR